MAVARVRYRDYVTWRWDGENGVAEHRWTGPDNKHALARLWWGGELFRDRANYESVVRAFVLQDLPNSYLHRRLVRCRPLALALVDLATQNTDSFGAAASWVNDLARVFNLATAASPPEAELGYPTDDIGGYLAWAATAPTGPYRWDDLPVGPPSPTASAPEAAAAIARRIASYAPLVAAARGSRSARQKGRTTKQAQEVSVGV
ncbi:DUF6339 family protein [Georgenia sp. SUBG003]|uniref:DUF6339 family protein n=1 Tax=Georgenia sp. SUBG003 TaxID=1497974 RepID=UPI003AB8E340